MKSLYLLVVAVAAVATSPGCLSYCDILYSGWKIPRRNDCNCSTAQQKLQGKTKHENDLKSILLPLKSQNRDPIFKDLHKDEDDYSISRIGNKSSEVKRKKEKRTSDNGEVPVETGHNSSITSKSLNEELNNTHVSEKDLSDCIDLNILINIRKHKDKNVSNLEPNGLGKNESLEINTEIKSKCAHVTTIIERSVEKIKEYQKLNNKKKDQDVNVTLQIDTDTESEVTDETSPVTDTKDDINTISSVKTTPLYDDFYTNAINTTHNTLILNPEKLNDSNAPILEHNIREETTDIYYNLKYLNDSFVMGDDNTTENNNDNLPNKDIEAQKNNPNDELATRKSLNPVTFLKRAQSTNNLTVDYFSNNKDGASETDKLITNSDVTTKPINLNENNSSFRDRYNESEVPVVRIITHEYPNDTISSIINGTEMLPNSDFEEDTIINNNQIKNKSDFNANYIASGSEPQSISDATPFDFEKQTFANTSLTVNGRFYFEYGQKKIPGHFVQTPDGQLQLNLDLDTICKELSQKGKDDSLISALCQCLS